MQREIKRHPLQPPRPSHVANKDCCQTGPASHIASPLFNLLNSCQCIVKFIVCNQLFLHRFFRPSRSRMRTSQFTKQGPVWRQLAVPSTAAICPTKHQLITHNRTHNRTIYERFLLLCFVYWFNSKRAFS